MVYPNPPPVSHIINLWLSSGWKTNHTAARHTIHRLCSEWNTNLLLPEYWPIGTVLYTVYCLFKIACFTPSAFYFSVWHPVITEKRVIFHFCAISQHFSTNNGSKNINITISQGQPHFKHCTEWYSITVSNGLSSASAVISLSSISYIWTEVCWVIALMLYAVNKHKFW